MRNVDRQIVRAWDPVNVPGATQYRCTLSADTADPAAGAASVLVTVSHGSTTAIEVRAPSVWSSNGQASGEGFTLTRQHLIRLRLRVPANVVLPFVQILPHVNHAATGTSTANVVVNIGTGQPLPNGDVEIVGRIAHSLANVTGLTLYVGDLPTGTTFRIAGAAAEQSDPAESPTFIFTFDDGFEAQQRVNAVGPLKSRGFQGTVGIISEYIGQATFMTEAQLAQLVADGITPNCHDVSPMHQGPLYANARAHQERLAYMRRIKRWLIVRGYTALARVFTWPLGMGTGINVTNAQVREYLREFACILDTQIRSSWSPCPGPTLRLTGVGSIVGAWANGDDVIGQTSGFRGKFSHFDAGGTVMYVYGLTGPYNESVGTTYSAGETVTDGGSKSAVITAVGSNAVSLGRQSMGAPIGTPAGHNPNFDTMPPREVRVIGRALQDYAAVLGNAVNLGGATWDNGAKTLTAAAGTPFSAYTYAAGDRLVYPRGTGFDGLAEVPIAGKTSGSVITLASSVNIANTSNVDAWGIVAADGTVKLSNLNLSAGVFNPAARTITLAGRFTGLGLGAGSLVYWEACDGSGFTPGFFGVASATSDAVTLSSTGAHNGVDPNTIGATSTVRITAAVSGASGLRSITRGSLHLATQYRAFCPLLVHRVFDDSGSYDGTHQKRADWITSLDYLRMLVTLGLAKVSTLERILQDYGESGQAQAVRPGAGGRRRRIVAG